MGKLINAYKNRIVHDVNDSNENHIPSTLVTHELNEKINNVDNSTTKLGERINSLESSATQLGEKINNVDSSTLKKTGGELSGTLSSTSEIISKSANAFRLAYGNTGVILRSDSDKFYLLFTEKGDTYGSWNGYRPLSVNLTDGSVESSSIVNLYGHVSFNSTANFGNDVNHHAKINMNGNEISHVRVRTCYGSYAEAGNRYGASSGVELREVDQVGETQTDIAYAPRLGFHWGGRVASSICIDTGGNFYLMNQQDNGYRNLFTANVYMGGGTAIHGYNYLRVLHDHGNGNTSVNGASGGLYIGLDNTTHAEFRTPAYAQNNNSYTVPQLRNIGFSSVAPSSLTNGQIIGVFE